MYIIYARPSSHQAIDILVTACQIIQLVSDIPIRGTSNLLVVLKISTWYSLAYQIDITAIACDIGDQYKELASMIRESTP